MSWTSYVAAWPLEGTFRVSPFLFSFFFLSVVLCCTVRLLVLVLKITRLAKLGFSINKRCVLAAMMVVGRILLLHGLFGAILVRTAPIISFPINSQVPPVARIGEPFSFVFSSTTFTSSDGSDLSYSLTDPPSWLSIDSANRRLSGTPKDGDVGAGTVVGIDITLMAADSTGSTALDATLVVSRDTAPTVQIPISEQIESFGSYSAPSSILYYPDQSFEFAFANDTFSDAEASELNYYTVMINNSPLPAWVTFDPSTLAFAGTTPPFDSLIEPPQTFSMKLIASDVTGFSGAWVNFSIVVGSHSLTTTQPEVALNATAGALLTYDGLVGTIELDGATVSPGDVNVTTENLPDWLSFDPSSWAISGTPSDTALPATFAVIVSDAYADILNITFDVEVDGGASVFESTFPPLSVRPGGNFTFNLGSYLSDPSDVDVTTDVEPAVSWITWDAASLILSGDVPTAAPESVVDVTFTAQPKSSSKLKRADGIQSQKLTIEISSTAETTSSSAGPSSTTSSSTSTTSGASSSSSPTSSSESTPRGTNWTIVAIVISAVAAFAFIACLCFYCCHRRKKNRDSQTTLDFSHRTSSNLDHPAGTLIDTPGQEVEAADPHTPITSPNEKKKSMKTSNLRSQISSSPPLPPMQSLADLYSYDGDHPSTTSTPGKVKEWFVRSFRVVQMHRARPRVSSTFFADDDGESLHHTLDLSGPPVINLSHNSTQSFRDHLDFAVPTALTTPLDGSSPQRPQLRVVNSDERRQSYQTPKATTTRTNPLPTPEASSNRLRDERDPFTDSPIAIGADENLSPLTIATRELFPSSPGFPSTLLPTSESHQPHRQRSKTHQQRTPTPLRPANSQKSFASASASSIDSMRGRTRKFAAKASAQAKGAVSLASMAMRSPKRRTLAALGKGRKPRKTTATRKRSQRGVLESVDDDDHDFVDGANRSEGGISSMLSPQLWPQPGTQSSPGPRLPSPVVLAGDSESQRRQRRRSTWGLGIPSQQRTQTVPIKRRPVPSREISARESGMTATTDFGSVSQAPQTAQNNPPPNFPLPNPRPPSTPLSSQPFGQGLGIAAYEDIASSSPWVSRRRPGEEASDADGELDDDEDVEEGEGREVSWTTIRTGSSGATRGVGTVPSLRVLHRVGEVEESPVIPRDWRRDGGKVGSQGKSLGESEGSSGVGAFM